MNRLLGRLTTAFRKRDTQRVYILKTIRKDHVSSSAEIARILAGGSVLSRIDNPFVVPLKFVFQSPERLHLGMPFVNGGELFHQLQREQRFDHDRARFYAAELLCGLECLHGYNAIYCGLQPKYIHLDSAGHIAICDFGLCKLRLEGQGDVDGKSASMKYPTRLMYHSVLHDTRVPSTRGAIGHESHEECGLVHSRRTSL